MKTTKKYRVERYLYPMHYPNKVETFNVTRETKNYLFVYHDVRDRQWTEKKFKDEACFKYFDSLPNAINALLHYARNAVKKAEEHLSGTTRNFEKIKKKYCIEESD